MLILTRTVGQSVVIPQIAEIKCLDVTGNRVKLGLEAPREVVILRNELCTQLSGRLSWEPAGKGEWVGCVDQPQSFPAWHLRITSDGYFDSSLSISSRVALSKQTRFASFEQACMYCESIEEAIALRGASDVA